MKAKQIDSWQGTGKCRIFELDMPIEGHSIIAEIQWYGIGSLNRAFFPCDGTRDGVSNDIFIGEANKTIEELGYEVVY